MDDEDLSGRTGNMREIVCGKGKGLRRICGVLERESGMRIENVRI